jgi:hypothetical protein
MRSERILSVSIGRVATVAAAMLTAIALPMRAQQDSAHAELRTVLRAFYFNLAHHDWEAIAADVLSAKILASRPAPASLERISASASPDACPASASALVGEALIHRDGDWAAVLVPRCGVISPGGDEFRLMHFQTRWRFVYINLFEDPVNAVRAALTP